MDDKTPGVATDDTPPRQNKRPGPTIELTATDVSDSDQASSEKISADQSSSAENSSLGRKRMKGFSMPAFRWPSFGGTGSLLGAVVTSALVAALIAGSAVFIGRSSSSSTPAPVENSVTQPDSAQIDALRDRMAALESRSGQPAQAPSADPELAAKIAAVETSLAALREDVATLRSQADSATTAIDSLKSSRQDIAAAPDTAALEERLTKLERATVALTADAPARPAPAAPSDPTVPRVAAAALLDQTVHQAMPYEAALSNARKFGDTDALKALEPFAATGVPTANALSRELLALLPQLAPKPGPEPAAEGILQRLQQSALKLVRVRRIDDAQLQDLIARVKEASRRDDIAEAKRLLLTLSESDRKTVQPWIDRADARDSALAAASRYARNAMSVMPRPANSQ